MGMVSVIGAIVIIIGWITLIEFDSYPESERNEIIQTIKSSPTYIVLIALMPVGIFINMLGGFFNSIWMLIIGASLILLQGIIVSVIFWKRKRWKSVLLFSVIVPLGIFIYLPLFIR